MNTFWYFWNYDLTSNLTGIHNTHMYEKAIVAMAKQSVTLEVLSYHASASMDDAVRLKVRIFFGFIFVRLMSKLSISL